MGLHKTATTTLQRHVFPVLPGLHFIDSARKPAAAIVYSFQVQDPIFFDSSHARVVLEGVLSNDKVNLISSESLSGSLYSAVGKRDLDHRHSIIENLQRTLPEAKIMLVLRRQDQFARAVYRQYIKRGGVLDPAEFFGLDGHLGAYFPRDRFRYCEYVRALKSRFPAGVHVGIFEEFAESPSTFLERMCRFLEVEALDWCQLKKFNRSRLGSTGLEVSRVLNRLFRSPLNPGGILPGIPLRRHTGVWWSVSPVYLLQDHWPGTGRVAEDSRLGRVCAKLLEDEVAHNKLLQDELNLDLERYGYL
ncbi:MAG: hypothetical protein ACRETY_00580 [Steroidobacteraceae bacterium]